MPCMSSPPLRVMFLTPYFRPYLGGIERAIERLSFGLMETSSVEAVGVLTTKYAFPLVPHPEWSNRDSTPEGISIFRLKGWPQHSVPLYSVPLVWFSPWQVKRYLDEFKPNIVHFVGDGWFWGHFWSWFWYRHRAEFVFTPSYHTLPVTRWWLRPINGFICNVMDHVVSLTQQEAQQVHRDYWAPRQKQVVIGWGASPLAQLPPELHKETITILCVGRLGWHKGQDWLLKVYQQARANFKFPTRLGLVFFEAMVCEMPVLTHDVGANRELLTQGSVVVPRFDQQAAADQLVRLVNDPEYRQRLGREAKEYALKEFTWSAVAGKYLDLYQTPLRGSIDGPPRARRERS